MGAREVIRIISTAGLFVGVSGAAYSLFLLADVQMFPNSIEADAKGERSLVVLVSSICAFGLSVLGIALTNHEEEQHKDNVVRVDFGRRKDS